MIRFFATLDHLVVRLLMLYKVYYNSMLNCNGELPSAFHRVRHTRAAVVAHHYELDVVRCRTSN